MRPTLSRASLRSLARVKTPKRFYATQQPSSDNAVGLADPVGYCRDLVRKHDYESYLISQFWPKDLQGSYFAIKALSVELATVQDHVSNTTIGKMRMQFWRDAIKDIFNVGSPCYCFHEIILTLLFLGQATATSCCTRVIPRYTTR